MPDPRAHNQSQADQEPLVQYEDLEQATGFTQINNAVLRCYPELSDGEKMTYAVLKSFAYVGPETFVGEETLARARDVTVSTVSRHLSRLVEVGLVKVRRRGQGKTNIWVICRIPRDKLEQYIEQWRPNLKVRKRASTASLEAALQDPQIKTSQDSQIKRKRKTQVKRPRNPQAEEEESREDQKEPQGRSRPGNGSLSTGNNNSSTTPSMARNGAESLESSIVENSEGAKEDFSTSVESVDNLAALVAEEFSVPEQQEKIAHYLQQYDAEIIERSLRTVIARLEHGDEIRNPVAYFYTVVRVSQAEHDATAADERQDDAERRAIARNWARSLMREWPLDQVQAILSDTYHDQEFVDQIIQEIADSAS
jgi:DNA-binding transcriptional ArsR family regulator